MQKQKSTLRGLLVILAGMLLPLAVMAEEQTVEVQRGSAAEAQALVASAIAYYDANGRESAFTAYQDKSGEFVDRDLYIFVYGPDRTVAAHGADVSLNGLPVDTLIDIHGKPFGTALMDGATEEGVWVEYTWYNPVDRELHPKSSWVVLHDGHVIGAGIYLQEDAETDDEAVDVATESAEPTE